VLTPCYIFPGAILQLFSQSYQDLFMYFLRRQKDAAKRVKRQARLSVLKRARAFYLKYQRTLRIGRFLNEKRS